MGARAYTLFEDEDFQPSPEGIVVEIGADRGEGSTAWLQRWAHAHGLPFRSADVDPAIVNRLPAPVRRDARNVDGETMLRRLRRPVTAAYLDGFDFIPAGEGDERWIRRQRNRYARLGLTLDNQTCGRVHLEEAHLVVERAASSCRIILDDTWHDGKDWQGKGALAVPYLLISGFTLVEWGEPHESSLGYAVMQRD